MRTAPQLMEAQASNARHWASRASRPSARNPATAERRNGRARLSAHTADRGPPDGHRLVGAGHADRRHLPDPGDDLAAPMDRIDERERRQTLWIVGRHGEPLDERRHVSSSCRRPVGPNRNAPTPFRGLRGLVGRRHGRRGPPRCARSAGSWMRADHALVSVSRSNDARRGLVEREAVPAGALREGAAPRPPSGRTGTRDGPPARAATRRAADRRSARRPAPAPRTRRRGRREASPDPPRHRAPRRPPRPASVRPPPGARPPGPDRPQASVRARRAPAGVARRLPPDGRPT